MYIMYMQGNLSHLHSLPDRNLLQAAFEYSIDTPPGMRALASGVPGLCEITSCHAPSGIHTTKGRTTLLPGIRFLCTVSVISEYVISLSVISHSCYIRFRSIRFHTQLYQILFYRFPLFVFYQIPRSNLGLYLNPLY